MWKGEARRKRIDKWIQLKEQLGPTIYQIRPSMIRIVQLVKSRKAVHPRSIHSLGDLGQITKADIRLKAEEGSSGVQEREGGSF